MQRLEFSDAIRPL